MELRPNYKYYLDTYINGTHTHYIMEVIKERYDKILNDVEYQIEFYMPLEDRRFRLCYNLSTIEKETAIGEWKITPYKAPEAFDSELFTL